MRFGLHVPQLGARLLTDEAHVEAVEHTIPPGVEPTLAKGGVRFYYFDPSLGHMPGLIVTFDHDRNQVEYYHFDRLQTPTGFDDADFDPDVVWKKK